jgi:hypothetical protein
LTPKERARPVTSAKMLNRRISLMRYVRRFEANHPWIREPPEREIEIVPLHAVTARDAESVAKGRGMQRSVERFIASFGA